MLTHAWAQKLLIYEEHYSNHLQSSGLLKL